MPDRSLFLDVRSKVYGLLSDLDVLERHELTLAQGGHLDAGTYATHKKRVCTKSIELANTLTDFRKDLRKD